MGHSHPPPTTTSQSWGLRSRLSVGASQADTEHVQRLELSAQTEHTRLVGHSKVFMACLLPAYRGSGKGHFEHKVRNLLYLKPSLPKRRVRVCYRTNCPPVLGHYQEFGFRGLVIQRKEGKSITTPTDFLLTRASHLMLYDRLYLFASLQIPCGGNSRPVLQRRRQAQRACS